MLQIEIFNKNMEAYEAWYDKYPEVFQSEVVISLTIGCYQDFIFKYSKSYTYSD